MPPIINAQGLSKKYGFVPLFDNISFRVSEGDRIGLIGPNGSGKSTLLELLYGRIEPDAGDVAIRESARVGWPRPDGTVYQLRAMGWLATVSTGQEQIQRGKRSPARPCLSRWQPAVVRKKLSYTEAREFAAIEERITTAEQELHAKRAALEDPSVQSDGHRLQSICAQLEEVENNVDKLSARWAELEQKQG